MADIVVIQLLPNEPISAEDFTNALNGLVIRAFDISFDSLDEGASVGEISFLPDDPTQSRIAQHFTYSTIIIDNQLQPELQAVATAIIEIDPLPSDEHGFESADGSVRYALDLRLEVERNGVAISTPQIYYNSPILTIDTIPDPIIPEPIPVDEVTLPGGALDIDAIPTDPYTDDDIAPVGLYLFLPPASQQIDPDAAFVELPEDGTPPNYAQLLAAVNQVLEDDLDNTSNLSALTPRQCQHIAREIIFNNLSLLPSRPIEELRVMFTEPAAEADEAEQDRARFEAEITSHYATLNANSERLAGYVYALSAAIRSAEFSQEAQQVGLTVPLPPDLTDQIGKIRTFDILLSSSGDTAITPSFSVLAEYFYALAAVFPFQITPEQRYQAAILAETEQNRLEFQRAIDTNIIAPELSQSPFQAAQRLRALGAGLGNGLSCDVETNPLEAPVPPLQNILQGWLSVEASANEDSIDNFWSNAFASQGYLALVICAITQGHIPLGTALQEAPPNGLGITTVAELSNLTTQEWRNFFLPPEEGATPNASILPPAFAQEGTPAEQVEAFIRFVRQFFDVGNSITAPTAQPPSAPPLLRRPTNDPIARFINDTPAGPFEFGTEWSDDDINTAVQNVFPEDELAQAWLDETMRSINDLFTITSSIEPESLQMSVMESLHGRGVSSIADVHEFTDAIRFQAALLGTVAYEHAGEIYANSQPPSTEEPVDNNEEGFQPINADCCLVNCIPPPHLSPLGPVAYLHELLRLNTSSLCEDPFPDITVTIIEEDGSVSETETFPADIGHLHLPNRCHAFNDLLVTQSNLEVPLPLVTYVIECLEFIASNIDLEDPPDNGFTHNTNAEELAGHTLCPLGPKTEAEGAPPEFCHEPNTLFCAVPEHSSPATPVAFPNAYENLKNDFSKPSLPYSQPLDICRTYLEQLGSSRYATMRTFWEEIWSFVLDPNNEPAGFPRHLWRYPVRRELACEYLLFTPEECNLLFTQDIVSPPTAENPFLFQLYGFRQRGANGSTWTVVVRNLCEFLKRTGLTFCEFIELQGSEFVRFVLIENGQRQFPRCEPCNLDDYTIEFLEPPSINEALKRLAVFIRLWRRLQQVKGAQYSFTELRDICDVLQLFDDSGTINPDFIEQLAAFQMLRDQFGLALVDKTDPQPSQTGADRTHLLALWVGDTATKWDWAIAHLLDKLQPYAEAIYHCKCRPPYFIKLLKENLDPLSQLMGFEPDTWHSLPTHTLRFAELLAKLYASEFGVGELFFLFTANDHLHGDDPFSLQPLNEALCSPLGLPDDEDDEAYLQNSFSLWALRHKLLAVEVTEEEIAAWTWSKIVASMAEDFDYDPTSDGNLLLLGVHFFPSILEAEGLTIPLTSRQYRTELPAVNTAPQMWNTLEDAAFRYDVTEEELWVQLPLTDKGVIQELSRIRQITANERSAIEALYFQPRLNLVPFAFLFPSFTEADQRLIQEADETERWKYFQYSFALCHKRCQTIAEHLAGHVEKVTGQPNTEDIDRAWLILKHLFADENKASSPWENDNGQIPNVNWPKPSGGAFAALLGVMGTGLLGEISDLSGGLTWREVRGPMTAFSAIKNAWNVPVPPTLLPAWNFSLPEEQGEWVTVRNGYALANPDGTILGGAQGFHVNWQGLLLIEQAGEYSFQVADFEAINHQNWRVMLKRGQQTIELLSHNWPDGNAPPDCSTPVTLRRGTYELRIELERPQPEFNGPGDLCPLITGFTLKYLGEDTGNELIVIPLDKLFIDSKDGPLSNLDTLVGAFLGEFYCATMRDCRRTYLRSFSTLLFTHRYELSAQPTSDTGESELGYMLRSDKQDNFAGQSYFRDNGGWGIHRAFFNFNFLPVLDNYFPPDPSQDLRAAPSVRRQQAFFDWWERMFDYVRMRQEARRAPEYPVWLLFHEAAELHEDNPAHLVRHMGVPLDRATLVLRYFEGYDVTSEDLEDDLWAVRVWWAEKYLRNLLEHFLPEDIRDARPDLWAADDPIALLAGETESGNQNLTQFYRNGCIENGDPRRYTENESLNNGLQYQARLALIAYLTSLDRVALPWGGFTESAKDLSEFLLMDVEAGICQKASRVEAAISIVQRFIQRACLGLEPDFEVTDGFKLLWKNRFSSFHIWQNCKRREIYRENWIDWYELEKAQRTESFQFLQTKLKESKLTTPVPGGMEYWVNPGIPDHSGLTLLQASEPAHIRQLPDLLSQPLNSLPDEGFNLLGMSEHRVRPSWLASLGQLQPSGVIAVASSLVFEPEKLPFWIRAAEKLGVLRIQASVEPPASTTFTPRQRSDSDISCCHLCGQVHPPLIDEFYFGLLPSEYFESIEQDAEWIDESGVSAWRQPEALPALLNWESEPSVLLFWSRYHNGEFSQERRSDTGVRVAEGELPQLVFQGRTADSLFFEVINGISPVGFSDSSQPGFRYDLATDSATVLPQVVAPEEVVIDIGGLSAYPYFAYFPSGAPLVPSSPFSSVLAVTGHLKSHCQFEAALKWLECLCKPLQDNLSELWCTAEEVEEAPEPDPDSNEADQQNISDELLRKRSLVLHYLEVLLQWGDALMQQDSSESRQQAGLIYETACRILGETPKSVQGIELTDAPQNLETFQPHEAALNPRLLKVYDLIEDRLSLIRSCQNAERLRYGKLNQTVPYWGNSPVRHGWQTNLKPCLDDMYWCYPHSCYRFDILIQSALTLVDEVISFGAALLSALEKGDAEYLSLMRATFEKQLSNRTLEIRQNQVRDADWQLQALEKTREMLQTRKRYITGLIEAGLNAGEIAYGVSTGVSTGAFIAGTIIEAIGQGMTIPPDSWTGGAGIAGSPLAFLQLPTGLKLASSFAFGSRIVNYLSEAANIASSVSLNAAAWERRAQEWRHEDEALGIQIEENTRLYLASDRRRHIALSELNNHQLQIEQSAEIQNFLRDKFTGQELYVWMQQELAGLYFQMYELAFHSALQAQQAFNYERGHTNRTFVSYETWDNLHEGLLAGEPLKLALRHMEKAYRDENCREYELTEHFSLRMYFPWAFLQLKLTGYCEIEIPEWLFDHFYPGQYMRRIKNVSLTIPCVVGPYVSVHCRLTLLRSTTRISPYLIDPPTACCAEKQPKNGYVPKPDDSRMINTCAASEAFATSSGRNDTGQFDFNFQDGRYQHFEYAGAVSCWRIELPQENNQFDVDTISDIILHLNYTAREGGEVLRQAASEVAQCYLPDQGIRFFDLKDDFPECWHRSQLDAFPPKHHPHYAGHKDHPYPEAKELELRLSRPMFPFLAGRPHLTVHTINLLFKAPGADPSAHHIVQFLPAGLPMDEHHWKCDSITIYCIANADWPGHYHGVLQLETPLGPLSHNNEQHLGTFRFPKDVGIVSQVYLFCGYEVTDTAPLDEWKPKVHLNQDSYLKHR